METSVSDPALIHKYLQQKLLQCGRPPQMQYPSNTVKIKKQLKKVSILPRESGKPPAFRSTNGIQKPRLRDSPERINFKA